MKVLLIFLTALSVVLCARKVDYCEVEKRLCGNKKHIGCEKNVFTESIYPLEKMKNEIRESILDQINSFRSLVATGKLSKFKSSSNMRLVIWNNEMEYLTSGVVNKDYRIVCSAIDTFPLSTSFSQQLILYKNTPSSGIRLIFENIFKDIVSNTNGELLKYSRFYAANLTNIGCSFGIFDNFDVRGINLECITNLDGPSSLTEAYLKGSPCSNCFKLNQVCSKKYPGLCEDSLKGEKSEKRETGITGARGADGLDGEKGDKGADGLDGKNGENGLNGEKGEKGETGITGARGADGLDGEKGADGLDGEKGEKGADGLNGLDGEKGSDGLNGEKGERGSNGLDGEKGSDGLTGEKGEKGSNGLNGEKGADGLNGLDGQKGSDGFDGLNGEKGEKGEKGVDGLDGKKGEKGEKGADGLNDHNCEINIEIGEHADKNENGEALFLAYYSSLKLKDSTIKNSLGQLINNFTKLLTWKEN